jgi:N-hydroxyarylamine O-acetyltransferase
MKSEDRLVLRKREFGGEWKNQYRFSLEPREYADYEEQCAFQQTSPLSHFTKGRICSLATTTGRITLSELRFITSTDSEKEERILNDENEYAVLLRERFGIVERLNFRVAKC